MASNLIVDRTTPAGVTEELVFAGDSVVLAGQIDYPTTPMPHGGFPLVFTLHHAGCNTRDCYQPYADLALSSGYAVFRWDKRGTGRSGAGGRGSTTQDAVNAYETALDQPHINRRGVVILAHGSGTGMLGSSFGLFARVQPPYGVVLVANVLDEDAVLAIDARLHILMSQNDWNPWQKYGKAACHAHNLAYPHCSATFHIVADADRHLNDTRDPQQGIHPGAQKVIRNWLDSLYPTSALV